MSNSHDMIVEFYEKISSWEQEVVKGTGISLPQMHAIELIGSYGPIRMKDLAHRLGVVMGTLTVMIKRLEQGGYVIRKENPDDHRSFRIELTDLGIEKYSEHHKHHIVLSQEISSHLTTTEQDQFNTILKKIVTNF